MTLKRLTVAAASIAAVLAPATAWAAGRQAPANVFAQCDGYGGPSPSGDGMTGMAYTLRIFVPQGSNGNTTRSNQAINAAGKTGVAACDDALANPSLEDRYWLRRVSLLRARAMHNLAAGDIDAAIADLDKAVAAAKDPQNVYYQRSLGLGIEFVRAYVLKMRGQTAKADAMALDLWRQRPYCREAALSALAVVGEAGGAQLEDLSRGMAKIEPRMIDLLFLVEFDAGHFQEVIDLYPQLVPSQEPMRDQQYAFQMQQLGLRRKVQEENFWVERAGQTAYALAALGRTDEAEDMLYGARKRLERETAPDAAFLPDNLYSPRNKQLVSQVSDLKIRLAAAGGDKVTHWERLVQVRTQIARGDLIKAAEGIDKAVKGGGAPKELFQAIVAKLEGGEALEQFKAELARREKANAEANRKEDLSTLFSALPEAEATDSIPPYREVDPPKFWAWDPVIYGYKTTLDGDGASIATRAGTIAKQVVGEMAMLQAADQALKAGKDGFVVVSRADIEHATVTTYYGMVMNTLPTGYSTDLKVDFVDRAHLPEKYAKAGWRVLDASAVRAALGPSYPPPPPLPPGAKKRK